MKAQIGKYYKHYKNGNTYRVLHIGYNSDLKEVVIYEAKYVSAKFGENAVWVRDRIEFEESLGWAGVTVERFSKITFK